MKASFRLFFTVQREDPPSREVLSWTFRMAATSSDSQTTADAQSVSSNGTWESNALFPLAKMLGRAGVPIPRCSFPICKARAGCNSFLPEIALRQARSHASWIMQAVAVQGCFVVTGGFDYPHFLINDAKPGLLYATLVHFLWAKDMMFIRHCCDR